MMSMEEMVRHASVQVPHEQSSTSVGCDATVFEDARTWETNQPFKTYYARLVGGDDLTVLTKERSANSAAWTFGNDLLIDGGLSPDTEIEVFAPDGTQHIFFLQPHGSEHVSVEPQAVRVARQKAASVPTRRVRWITFE